MWMTGTVISHASVKQGIDVIGLELTGSQVTARGLIEPVQTLQDQTAALMDFGRAVIQFQSEVVLFERLFVSAQQS
jgi:hypothetical protein